LIIEPGEQRQGEDPNVPENRTCTNAVPAVVVEGPGKRGEVIQVCTNPECEVHGQSNHKAEERAAAREREQQWKREEQQWEKNRESNCLLLDAVLERIPKVLMRADYEMLVVAAISRLDWEEDVAVLCARYNITTDDISEPDAAHFELERSARGTTEPQLIRMLIELALLHRAIRMRCSNHRSFGERGFALRSLGNSKKSGRSTGVLSAHRRRKRNRQSRTDTRRPRLSGKDGKEKRGRVSRLYPMLRKRRLKEDRLLAGSGQRLI
jgi:hypothetical protein